MIALLMLFVPTGLPDVSLDDRDRFPTRGDCFEQMRKCDDYRDWLLWVRPYRSDRDNVDRSVAWAGSTRLYWEVLEDVQTPFHCWPGNGQGMCLHSLERLRKMIGPYAYGKGWFPEKVPDGMPRAPLIIRRKDMPAS